MFGPEDAEREQFFEAARAQAQREFDQDPTNAQALLRWGGALLELAHFKSGKESVEMIQQAIEKLNTACSLDPEKPDGEWCLGNAYTSLGFLQDAKADAMVHFHKAGECFRRCQRKQTVERERGLLPKSLDVINKHVATLACNLSAMQDPSNETYKKAIEMCEKAPDYYDEIQQHIQAQAAAAEAMPGKPAAPSSAYDFWWDVGGWMVLGGVVVAAFMLARSGSKPTATA